MLKMKKERFYELGLGYDKEACLSCEDCVEKDGKYYCSSDMNSSIEELEKKFTIADCVDEERIRIEMTEEEYDAFRHNRIEVVE